MGQKTTRKLGGRDAFFYELSGVVGGTIIDDQKFEIWIFDLFEIGKVLLKMVATVSGANGDGDEGELGGDFFKLREKLSESVESWLSGTVAARQSKGPVDDFQTAIEPAVAPGVDREAGDGAGSGALIGPRKHFALSFFEVGIGEVERALSPSIEPELSEEERAVACDVVEALEVALELGLFFQVNVEGGKVGVTWLEILGGGKVAVGVEEVGSVLAAFGKEVLEGISNFGGAHEADKVGADLVGDDESRESGVISVAGQKEGEVAFGITDGVWVFGEEGVGIPRDNGEYEKVALLGEVEFLSAGGVVKANGVEASGCDAGEFDGRVERLCSGEGAIGNGVDETGSSLILKKSTVDCECHCESIR